MKKEKKSINNKQNNDDDLHANHSIEKRILKWVNCKSRFTEEKTCFYTSGS